MIALATWDYLALDRPPRALPQLNLAIGDY